MIFRGYTASWAATCKAPTRHAITKSRCTRRCSGKMGSRATYRSTNRKQIPKTADKEKRIQTRGCVQGTFCPPISRAIKKLVMVTASVTVPGKSTRLSFRFSDPPPYPGKSFWGPSSFQATKRMATSASGHWIRNDLWEKDQYRIAIFPKGWKLPPSPTNRITQIATNWTTATSSYCRCNVYNASPCCDLAQRNRICTKLEPDSGYLKPDNIYLLLIWRR